MNLKRSAKYLCLLSALLFVQFCFGKQDPIDLRLLYVKEDAGQTSLQQVLNDYSPTEEQPHYPTAGVNLGASDSAVWLIWQLASPIPDSHWVFTINNHHLETASYRFLAPDFGVIKRFEYNRLSSLMEKGMADIGASISIPETSQYIAVRLQSSDALSIYPEVKPLASFIAFNQQQFWLFGICSGIMVGLFLYHLFLSSQYRFTGIKSYCFLTLCSYLAVISNTGYGNRFFWSESIRTGDNINDLSSPLVIVASLIFFNVTLEFKKHLSDLALFTVKLTSAIFTAAVVVLPLLPEGIRLSAESFVRPGIFIVVFILLGLRLQKPDFNSVLAIVGWTVVCFGNLPKILLYFGYQVSLLTIDTWYIYSMTIWVMLNSGIIANQTNHVFSSRDRFRSALLKAREVDQEKLQQAIRTKAFQLRQTNRRRQLTRHTDAITGLRNQAYYKLMFQQKFNEKPRAGMIHALVLIDIKQLYTLNEETGIVAANNYLRAIAKMVKQVFAKQERVICRSESDEFMVLLPNVSTTNTEAQLQSLAESLHTLASHDTYLSKHPCRVCMAKIHDNDHQALALIEHCKTEIDAAEQRGSTIAIFDAANYP